jgi:hypothetical protein
MTGPGLLPLKEGQCVVVCDADCISVRSEEMWMHNLYWRFKRTSRSDNSTNQNENAVVRLPCWPACHRCHCVTAS